MGHEGRAGVRDGTDGDEDGQVDGCLVLTLKERQPSAGLGNTYRCRCN